MNSSAAIPAPATLTLLPPVRSVASVSDAQVRSPAELLIDCVDGGASVMDLLLQLQADQLGVDVSRPVVAESTALGAAFAAGLAEGVWGSPGEVLASWKEAKRFRPENRDEANRLYADWHRAVDRSRGWAEHAPTT